MASARRPEPFTSADAAWLRMEDPTNLMMITGVLMFDERIDVERLRAVIEQRLLRFDRFRMRVKDPHRRGGTPQWELDPYFNLRSHIHRVALPSPGGQAELQALVSDLMSMPLDFSKPLWHIHLVESPTGESALLTRIHHSIADGIALVQVLLSLTDSSPDAELPEPAAVNGGGSGVVESLLAQVRRAAGLATRTGESLGGELSAVAEDPSRLLGAVRGGIGGAQALNKLLFMPSDPPTLFKGKLGVEKRAAWSQPIPLDQIKLVGRMTRGTINDVLLTAVAGALRRYLLRRGAQVDGLDVRAVIPVNLRPPGPITELGNRFSVVFLALPVGIDDPFDRLIELRRRMELIKDSPEALVAFTILNLIGVVPPDLADMAVGLFGSKATAVMTNVPGPREPIYFAGSQVRKIMFWVPQSGHLGLGVSILSYAGDVLLGIATDVGLVPDPDSIIADFHAEVDDLVRLAQVVEGLPTPDASRSVYA